MSYNLIRKCESMGVIALTQAELDALYNFDLTNNKRFDQVRDVFCFSCATGLRYSDIAQLRQGHIQDGTITIVAMIFFDRRTIFIRFVGTHSEDDKIDCSTIEIGNDDKQN